MQIDPVEEWRRLTQHYRQMSDGDLERLAFDFSDLTETAQQVLSGELRHRGLDKPRASDGLSTGTGRTQPARAASLATQADDAETLTGTDEQDADDQDDDAPREYTWKTVLCECEEWDQVLQLQEMLRRAGIDSWTDGPTSIGDSGLLYPRVLVAADQLDEARLVIAKPIPQDVIDDSRMTVPDFEIPRCPGCRAEDPVLEDTDPVNSWRCESCGRRWTDPARASEPEQQKL